MTKYHFIKKHFLPGLSCDFQFQIEKGRPFVICGENGIGKSTFLKLFYHEMEKQKTKVFIPQKASPPFFDRKIKVLKKIIKNLPDINIARFDQYWSGFNLNLKEESFLSTLSGGERQMLQLNSLLAKEAEIYLLDEPTVGLDDKNKKMFLSIIQEISPLSYIFIVEHETSWIPKEWSSFKIIRDNSTVRFDQ